MKDFLGFIITITLLFQTKVISRTIIDHTDKPLEIDGKTDDRFFYVGWGIPAAADSFPSKTILYGETKQEGLKISGTIIMSNEKTSISGTHSMVSIGRETPSHRLIRALIQNGKERFFFIYFSDNGRKIEYTMIFEDLPLMPLYNKNIYWFRMRSAAESFNFNKNFILQTNQHRVYPLVVFHNEVEEAFKFLKDKYDATTDLKIKSEILPWIGEIHTHDAVNFLRDLYNQENNREIKEIVISTLGKLSMKHAAERLIEIIISEKEEQDFRKSACFVYSEMETTTAQDLYGLLCQTQSAKLKADILYRIYDIIQRSDNLYGHDI